MARTHDMGSNHANNYSNNTSSFHSCVVAGFSRTSHIREADLCEGIGPIKVSALILLEWVGGRFGLSGQELDLHGRAGGERP